MGERLRSPDEMASTSAGGGTTVITADEVDVPEPPVTVITLRPTKPKTRKKVIWTEDTVDNENMNKKKSKCCCIYEKPRKFDESSSSSSDDEDCEHCFGHVEKRKKRGAGAATSSGGGGSTEVQTTPAEGTLNITTRPPEGEPAPPDKHRQPENVS